MMKQITLTLLAVGVLSGCSMAPKYMRPDAPVAASYPEHREAQGAQRSAAETGWRDFFHDARLQTLIGRALENNRDLRVAALRIEEARAQYNIVQADRVPNLNGTATGNRGRTPASVNQFGQSVVTSNYQVGVSLASFELDFFGRVKSLSDAALASYLSTEEARVSAQLSLISEVAKAYLNERAFAEQEELARRTLESRAKGYELAKQRFDVGATSALDLQQNEALLQTARVTAASVARQRAQAWNALTVLVGQPLTDLPAPQPLSSQDIVTELPAGLPSDLLVQRPDIRSAEQTLLAANANIGAARAAFFPRISLTAGVGTASNSLDGLFESGSRAWSFAPQLVLPIFQGGRNTANLNLAEVRKNIAVANYEKTIQVAFQEVADALVARGFLDEQADAQERVQRAQAERMKFADQRFENGIASSLDVLDAQRELFSAEQELVQIRLLRLTNAVDLYRSLGGGIRETTATAAAPTTPATPAP
ncbi:MAG: efflux transporter outer membrane subunit [Oxalicibacterium faecigallinarum]|uniref:efflux transporter outer membrane subunit n=1 Tax=Oxalicibacterium faecigallinarum TaxID=573741 RepID=UPI00280A14F9|nr:efflux transporter outer membrane subunit [Oxalicibacterium faecigallinarum]MDQ7968026.1 efflux transporter outer membrane subunit [Oxalicibacterium faecigallinarum]